MRTVKTEIALSNVVLRAETEPRGEAIDRIGLSFELDIATDGDLVDRDLDAVSAVNAAVFLIAIESVSSNLSYGLTI